MNLYGSNSKAVDGVEKLFISAVYSVFFHSATCVEIPAKPVWIGGELSALVRRPGSIPTFSI
jgi:hypothetical protein